jgi:hypothetical protein
MECTFIVRAEIDDKSLDKYEKLIGVKHERNQSGVFPIEIDIADEIHDILAEHYEKYKDLVEITKLNVKVK